MPGYVNIGAYVDSGTMVDTHATVGSCAQVGKNVHLAIGKRKESTDKKVSLNKVPRDFNIAV
jgi:2,3,4,5-tetrahydropyridine-2-carboxylate N-succinyltransferase